MENFKKTLKNEHKEAKKIINSYELRPITYEIQPRYYNNVEVEIINDKEEEHVYIEPKKEKKPIKETSKYIPIITESDDDFEDDELDF